MHEHVGMNPIESAASDCEYYLNLAPLFFFPKKAISGLCKDLLLLFFCAIIRTPIFPLSIISVILA